MDYNLLIVEADGWVYEGLLYYLPYFCIFSKTFQTKNLKREQS